MDGRRLGEGGGGGVILACCGAKPEEIIADYHRSVSLHAHKGDRVEGRAWGGGGGGEVRGDKGFGGCLHSLSHYGSVCIASTLLDCSTVRGIVLLY